jgi:hypothetical protein
VDRPAARRAREYLAALNSGDPDAAPGFARAHPGPRPAEHHAAWMALFRRQTGGLDLEAEAARGDNSVDVLCQARTGGDRWRLRVRVSPAAPHPMVDVGLAPALPRLGAGLDLAGYLMPLPDPVRIAFPLPVGASKRADC